MSFTWPDETILPRPTPSLSQEVLPNTVRTDMDSGKPRQRLRFTSGWRTIGVSWVFTNEQFAIFQAILKYKLNNGADFFDMSLPIGDPDDVEEETFAVQSVRFIGGEFSIVYQDVMYWKISAKLETEETSPMDEAALDAILT